MAGIFGLLMSGAGVIKDQYFNLTSLLLPGNGTDGKQNRTFKDSSVNDFLITPNGNATQGTFSPFSQTGWGGNFNGTSYIQAPDNATMQVGASDFTIEMWAYFTSDFTGAKWLGGKGDQSTAAGSAFSLNGTAFEVYSGSTGYSLTCPTWTTNRWYHIAIVRSGTSANNLKLYIDGAVQSQASISTNSINSASGNGLKIGAYSSAGVASYISNFRFVKGRAVYTSAFTPPTSPLGITSGGQNPPQGTETSLLVLQSNRFVDIANNYTLTLSSSPSVTPFSPFAPTQSYSASAVGGSGYFDGTSDYLTANSAGLELGSNLFTVDGWFYCTGYNGGSAIYSSVNTYPSSTGLLFYVNSTGGYVIDVNGTNIISTGTAPLNTWTHFAIVRSSTGSNGVTLYINGSALTPGTSATNFSSTYAVIGRTGFGAASNYWLGYLSGIRVVVGSANVPSSVPTSPPTAITNTSLLLNFTNGGVIDATAKNVLETVGTAQISTTTAKFGGSSIYLSGDGNYLTSRGTPVFSLNGDFTMEAWVYPINAGRSADAEKYGTIVSCSAPGVNSPEFSWFVRIVSSSITEYFLNINGTTVLQVTGLSVSLNAWHYFAVTRSGTGTGNVKLYVDGTLVGTSSGASTQSPTFSSSQTLMVGRNANSATYQNWLSGYFQGVRITPGYVRTVTTIPTAPFPVQ